MEGENLEVKNLEKLENAVKNDEMRRERILYFYIAALFVPIILGAYILIWGYKNNEEYTQNIETAIQKKLVSQIDSIKNLYKTPIHKDIVFQIDTSREKRLAITKNYIRQSPTQMAGDSLKYIYLQITLLQNQLKAQNPLFKLLKHQLDTLLNAYYHLANSNYRYLERVDTLKYDLSILKEQVGMYHGFSIADKKEIYDELTLIKKEKVISDSTVSTLRKRLEEYPKAYYSYELPINTRTNLPATNLIVQIDSVREKKFMRILIRSSRDIIHDTLFGPASIALGKKYTIYDKISERRYNITPTYIQNKLLRQTIVGISVSEN